MNLNNDQPSRLYESEKNNLLQANSWELSFLVFPESKMAKKLWQHIVH